jgi:hypothetical protein
MGLSFVERRKVGMNIWTMRVVLDEIRGVLKMN